MIATSKWMAYILRYGAGENGLQKRPGGWLKISDLEAIGRASEAEIFSVLSRDSSGRFQCFCHRGEFWVRAVPGRGKGPIEPSAVLVPPLRHADSMQHSQQDLGGGHAGPVSPPPLSGRNGQW